MKKRTPSERSVYLTSRLMPGAETLRSFAAPVIVPEIITARMTSICLSVIIAADYRRWSVELSAIIADAPGEVHRDAPCFLGSYVTRPSSRRAGYAYEPITDLLTRSGRYA